MTDPERRFADTAARDAAHRPGYPAQAITDVADRAGLDGSGRVLDVGTGTGRLAVAFADRAGEVVAIDPNPAMVKRARERVSRAGRANVTVRNGSDADLGDEGPLRLTTIGRAFHWLDQERTLARLAGMTEPGGGIALFDDEGWLLRETASWQATVYDIVSEFADPPERTEPQTYERTWADVIRASRFSGVETREYEREQVWTVDSIVGYVLSLSYCDPVRENQEAFERAVRARLDGPYERTATVETTVGLLGE